VTEAHLQKPGKYAPGLRAEMEQEQAPERFRRSGRGPTPRDRPCDAGAVVCFGCMCVEVPGCLRVGAFRLHAGECG